MGGPPQGMPPPGMPPWMQQRPGGGLDLRPQGWVGCRLQVLRVWMSRASVRCGVAGVCMVGGRVHVLSVSGRVCIRAWHALAGP